MNRMPWVVLLASLLALLGGAIGIAGAMTALRTVGGDPAYRSRVLCGWIALFCAIVATLGVLRLLRRRTLTAAALTLVASTVGTVAINLFYINTFYVAALPCWWLGVLAMALGPP